MGSSGATACSTTFSVRLTNKNRQFDGLGWSEENWSFAGGVGNALRSELEVEAVYLQVEALARKPQLFGRARDIAR